MKELFDLFLTFFKIGLFTFGGGLSMLPMLQREVIDKKEWITPEEMLDYYTVGQCVPGVIAVNISAFTGMKRKGVLGAVAATLGTVTPSIIVITAIAGLITNFSDLPAVAHALSGIRAAVCAMISVSVYTLIKKGVQDIFGVIILIAAVLLVVFLNFSPVSVVVISVLYGIGISLLKTGRRKNNDDS